MQLIDIILVNETENSRVVFRIKIKITIDKYDMNIIEEIVDEYIKKYVDDEFEIYHWTFTSKNIFDTKITRYGASDNDEWEIHYSYKIKTIDIPVREQWCKKCMIFHTTSYTINHICNKNDLEIAKRKKYISIRKMRDYKNGFKNFKELIYIAQQKRLKFDMKKITKKIIEIKTNKIIDWFV